MNPRTALITAPVLTFCYGVIRIVDGLDGTRGPGLAWTAGHLAFLGAMVMFIAVFVHLRRMAGRNILSTVLAVVATAGALALAGQFSIDIVAGLLSTDHLDLSLRSAQWRSTPGVSFAVYDVGPYLFYLGQLALIVQLAVMRRISVWTPVLVLFDLATPFIDKDLIPLGSGVLLVSFVMISRRIPAPPASVPAAGRQVSPV